MSNDCYAHAGRRSKNSCVVCNRKICGDCSHWVAASVYVCPECWQASGGIVDPGKVTQKPSKPLGGTVLSRRINQSMYYGAALVVTLLGVWYIYTTFAAPVIFRPPYP